MSRLVSMRHLEYERARDRLLAQLEQLRRRRNESAPFELGPRDEAGNYTCPCGTDRNGVPYNERTIGHVHRRTGSA